MHWDPLTAANLCMVICSHSDMDKIINKTNPCYPILGMFILVLRCTDSCESLYGNRFTFWYGYYITNKQILVIPFWGYSFCIISYYQNSIWVGWLLLWAVSHLTQKYRIRVSKQIHIRFFRIRLETYPRRIRGVSVSDTYRIRIRHLLGVSA